MGPDELPRHRGEDDELPDDFGSRPGDTLSFGSGSFIRTLSSDDAHRFLQRPDPEAIARAWEASAPPPDEAPESRPEPRGLARLLPTGWRRGGRRPTAIPALSVTSAVIMPAARLTIELVPATSWYRNVRALVDEPTWDRIRRKVYRRAGYRCELCGGRGPAHPVECHEVWRYDDQARTQTLAGMVALCPACHQVKHLGLANVRGTSAEARAQLMRVNGWTPEQADAYIEQAFQLWERRSQWPWTLDLDGLRPYVLGSEYPRIVRLAAIPPERRGTIES
jgi:hypothetical protein